MYREKILTNLEEMIINCIWDSPEAMSLSVLVETVNARYHKDWRPQTISTYLAHLVKNGYLRMERRGRVFLYYPILSREAYFADRLHALIEYWQALAAPKDFLCSIAAPLQASDIEDLKALTEKGAPPHR